jgi:hypothetical protein
MKAIRPHFLGFLLLLPLALSGAPTVADSTTDKFRGGKVQWARLKTESRHWNRHSEGDSDVLDLMRAHTSLNIDDTWYSANAATLEGLCAYPFIFSENITFLPPAEGDRLAEYLRRGGFMLLDACIDVRINPDAEAYLTAQKAALARLLPEARIVVLEPKHEIFSIYFKLAQFPPQTASRTNPRWANHSTAPLRGVFLGERMIGVISLSGFQCAWAGRKTSQSATDAIQMVTNIYVYAMTR